MNFKTFTAIIAAGAASALVSPAAAQSATTFTYQGRLTDAGSPADGMYEFQVRLLDGSGVQVALTKAMLADVSEGMFMLDLDFGSSAFNGSYRELEIGVRSVMSGGAYTILTPNTPVTSTPVAQFALDGNQGPQGPAGPQGPQGAQGPQGPQGNTGPQGEAHRVNPARPARRGQKAQRDRSARPARRAGRASTTSPPISSMAMTTRPTTLVRGSRSLATSSRSQPTPSSRA